jgi:glycosyltransferase involved in cell wall biosynthesis
MSAPAELPTVTCICPTYNRKKFLPWLLEIYKSQDYPQDRRELLIVDDSPESNQELVDQFKAENPKENLIYVWLKKRLPLGLKRNFTNQLAKGRGDYIMCFDDDDYYPPDRISFAIERMRSTGAPFSGTSELYLYYCQLDEIYRIGKIADTHATNATFCYTQKFLETHKYEDNATLGEEKAFLNGFTERVLHLPTLRCMLVICHSKNTFDKAVLLKSIKRMNIKLEDLVKNPRLVEFYKSLKSEFSTDSEKPAIEKPALPSTTEVEKEVDKIIGEN